MAAYELTDEAWELVSDLFDPPVRRGPRASVPRRQVVEAILWLARTGAQWRELPERYGSWSAIWSQWRRWRDKGVWGEAMRRLNAVVREAEGRDQQPSVVIIDAQTTRGRRAGPGFHEKGGAGGRTRGTKRSIVVDTLGLPIVARADSARPHDSKVGKRLLDDVLPLLPRVALVVADPGYRAAGHHVASMHGVMFEVRGWDERPPEGFKPIKPMWRVEDAFARLGAWRRMSRCFEGSQAGATAWLQVACVGLLAGRLRARQLALAA